MNKTIVIANGIVGLLSGMFFLFAWSFMTNFDGDANFLQMVDNPVTLGMFVCALASVASSLVALVSFLPKNRGDR